MRKFLMVLLVILLIFPGAVFGKMKKTSKPKSHLKSIYRRGLKEPIRGDLMQAALEVVQDLMKTKGLKFEKQKGKESGFKPKRKEAKVDKLGHKHIRMFQYYKGLPVIGGELIVHINKQNVIHRINGKYLSPINISTEPIIDGDTALQIGMAELQEKIQLRVTKEPSLVIYDSHLAFHFVISHKGPELGHWWYYVDAHTGEVILRYNNIQFCNPTTNGDYTQVEGYRLEGEGGEKVTIDGWYDNNSQKYYLYNDGNAWGVFDQDTNCWALNNTSDWDTSDRAAISAGKNISLTQLWLSDPNVLDLCSFDDNCTLARVNVHYVFCNQYGCHENNAQYDYSTNTFNFGDGDGSIFDPFTTLDCVAHEVGHAVTHYSSGLQYYGETGALNESYSDIMGAAVEFAYQTDGRSSYPCSEDGKADWLCGEDFVLNQDPNKEAKRDFKNPKRFDHPSYYGGINWYTGTDNIEGVHTNNGVQNFAFYLLAEGGEGTNDGHPYSITGIGINNAVQVAMFANIYNLTSRSTFFDARFAWVDAADDLGLPTATVEAVWDAVGVKPPAEWEYNETLLSPIFLGGGVHKNSYPQYCCAHNLPFTFPFYGQNYTSVWICTSGYLEFNTTRPTCNQYNYITELIHNVRIAPFWTDLSYYDPNWYTDNYDIFTHQPSADSVCIRWHVRHKSSGDDANFEVVLYQDGRIQFNYGDNPILDDPYEDQPPTVGISSGDPNNFCLSTYNQLENLSNVDSTLFVPILDNWNFQNRTVSSGIFEANESITADPNVTIANGAVVTFDAENSITAGNNFIIEENALVTFEATTITADNTFTVKSGAVVTFEATDYIIIGPDFTIESGAEVYLRAGNYVRILPEFTAHEGCVFEVDNLI